jgi:hypothetical protein
MQGLKRELKKIGSLAIFFFIGFGYILLVMKLFLKEYSINSYVLSKAIIGSLVAAKAVAIMDITPLIKRFDRSSVPRYISVLYKTLLYTLAVLLLGVIEHLFETYRKTKTLAPAVESFFEPTHLYHFFAVLLCISIVFLIHNIFHELDSYLGKGNLKKFFFEHS